MTEYNISDFRKNMNQFNRTHGRGNSGAMNYLEALNFVREKLKDKLAIERDLDSKEGEVKSGKKKTKADLRAKQSRYKHLINEILTMLPAKVEGYQDRMHEFLDEMVEEFAGYSILADAFYDDEVSDIFVVSWDTIFVEKAGVNKKYHKTFRSPEHFEDTLKRFLTEAGLEINNGEKKIVNFELYQDRGCATSKMVSPNDFSLTLRKHSEDHITLDNLLDWNVLSYDMSEFLGIAIKGEANIICAGITGSGKTTSVRAMLDYSVSKLNRRMLVCEDTQELFPKNEHTLELVTSAGQTKEAEITLTSLVYTALRLKPKYIVVGEVRGEEAQAAVEAMETGHSTIFTMHGGNPWNIINRIVTKYLMAMPSLGMEVVERIIGSSLDYIFIQDNIPGVGRKITSISEVSYDFEQRRMVVRDIAKFNRKTMKFDILGGISDEKADTMFRRGVTQEELEKWSDEKIKERIAS